MQNIDPIRQTHKRNVLTPDIAAFSYFSRRAKTNVGGYLRLPACARIYVYIHNGSSVTYACNPSNYPGHPYLVQLVGLLLD